MENDIREYLEKCNEEAEKVKGEIRYMQGKLGFVETTINSLENILNKKRAIQNGRWDWMSNAYEKKEITYRCGHKETLNNINTEYFDELCKQLRRLKCNKCEMGEK